MPPRVSPKAAVPERRRFWSRGMQYAVIVALLLAPLLALVIQLARPPVEPALPVGNLKARALGPFIAGLLATPQASQFECSLEEVNQHLGQLLQPVRKPSGALAFQRLFLRLEPELCHVRAVYQWRGREWHVRVTYSLQVHEGRLKIKAIAGSLGRMELGQFWLAQLQAPLARLLPALKREVVLVNRMEMLRLEPNRIVFKVRASSGAPSAL